MSFSLDGFEARWQGRREEDIDAGVLDMQVIMFHGFGRIGLDVKLWEVLEKMRVAVVVEGYATFSGERKAVVLLVGAQ